jgi:hypothetical protein
VAADVLVANQDYAGIIADNFRAEGATVLTHENSVRAQC